MNLTQLLKNQKVMIALKMFSLPVQVILDIQKSTEQFFLAVIRSEIERKKGMLMTNTHEEETSAWFYGYGYNTAIAEDIAYLENALKEIEKNV